MRENPIFYRCFLQNNVPAIIQRGNPTQNTFISEPAVNVIDREPINMARVEPIITEKLSHPGINDMSAIPKAYPLHVPGKQDRNPGEEQKFSIWTLADAGIHKINELSEEAYSLDRKTDELGKTRRLTIETPLFGLSAPVRNLEGPR